jgi:hypothetical protein
VNNVKLYSEHVLGSVLEHRGEVIGKAGEAIRMIPKLRAVAGDVGIHVRTIKKN